MKQVGIREARADLPKLVKRAQKELHLLTHHGKPAALLVGVEGYDYDDLLRMLDPEFWRMIAARRASKAPRLTLEELDAELGRSPQRRHPRR